MPVDFASLADLPAEEFFKRVLSETGWTLEELAEAAGYKLETIQKARRGHAEVALTDKMRRAILKAAELAKTAGKTAERLEEESLGYRVVVFGTKPMNPPEEQMIDQLIDMLRDYKTASAATRRVLLANIDEIFASLKKPKPPSLDVERTDRSVRPGRA